MTKHATLVLGPSELKGLLREYPEKLFNTTCIALTPDVYECAQSDQHLKSILFPEWVQSIRTFSLIDYQLINKKLKRLETTSSKMRQKLFSKNSPQVDWNYQSNYALASMLASARNFAMQAVKHLEPYELINIISLNHAGEFYFDSCIQPTILCDELQRLGVRAKLILLDERAKSITHQPELYETLPNLFSKKFLQEWQSLNKSVVLATSAIYSKDDQQKLRYVLQGAYSDSLPVSYPLPLWQVINSSSLFLDRCTTMQALDHISPADRANCLLYAEWLTDTTENSLIEILDQETYRDNPLFQAQVNRLLKRHLLQTLTFIGWCSVFKIQKTQMLALSIQDSSINGPMANAAKLFGIDVFIFPHSHIVNWETPCECIVATEWWQPVSTHTLWGQVNQCIYFDTELHQKEFRTSSTEAQTWMILFNGMQENLANSVAWPFLQQVVGYINAQAKASGAHLTHRLKPGDQTPVSTFCELLEIDVSTTTRSLLEPLHDLLIATDLVISIDDPSTALWQALSTGCAVVLITDRPLPFGALVDNDILRPISFAEFSALMLTFIKDPNELENYRAIQQKKFLTLRLKRLEI